MGGWVLKMKLKLLKLSTKFKLKLKLKFGNTKGNTSWGCSLTDETSSGMVGQSACLVIV